MTTSRSALFTGGGRRLATAFSYLLLALLALHTSAAAAQPVRKPPVFVLMPATWQGGWYWQQVSARLRAAGGVVYTPSLSGLAEHRHTLSPAINWIRTSSKSSICSK